MLTVSTIGKNPVVGHAVPVQDATVFTLQPGIFHATTHHGRDHRLLDQWRHGAIARIPAARLCDRWLESLRRGRARLWHHSGDCLALRVSLLLGRSPRPLPDSDLRHWRSGGARRRQAARLVWPDGGDD